MDYKKKAELIKTLIFSKNFVKYTAMLGFFLISLINTVTFLNPAQGYEVSIYESTPALIWYSLILSASCGIIIIILEVYTKKCYASCIWLCGFILLLISRLTLLFIPYNRGYLGWRGDHSSHIGTVKDIVETGYTFPDNHYPISHILLSEISIVSDIPSFYLTMYFTAILSIFSVFGIYMIVKYISNDKKVVLLTLAAIGFVIVGDYHISFTPNGYSVLFLSFALFLIIKSMEKDAKFSYRILAVIMVLLYPFFHTLSALMFTASLSLIFLMILILNNSQYISTKIRQYCILPDRPPSIFLLGILAGIWIIWTLSFRTFRGNVRGLYRSALFGDTSNVIGAMGERAARIDLNITDFIELFIRIEGVNIIFLILFFVGFYLAYWTYHKEQEFKASLIFFCIILSFGFLYFSYLLGIIPGLGMIAGGRTKAYAFVLIPVFVGFVYAYLLNKKTCFCILLCIGIIITPVVLTVFGTFSSPYVKKPTSLITNMDLQGFEWSFTNGDEKIEYSHIMSSPHRFADALLGVEERKKRSATLRRVDQINDHFNYKSTQYLGENFPSDRYLPITQFDRIIYDTVWKTVGRFNEEDFIRLKNDRSVQFLYTNGECEVYYIQAREYQ